MKKRYLILPALALGLGLAGCAGPATPGAAPTTSQTTSPATGASTVPTPVTIPAKPVVDRKNPASVAAAFVAGAYAWNTTTDLTRTDALKRVAYLATPQFSKDFVAPQNPSNGPQWLAAAQHQAISVPTITAIPAGTESEANTEAPFRILAFRAQWLWQGTDGVKIAGGYEMATVTVDKDDTGHWYVSAFSTTDTGS